MADGKNIFNGGGFVFSSKQIWMVVFSFLAFLLIFSYTAMRGSDERHQQLNLSRIIIKDIENISPEEEQEIISDLKSAAQAIPKINKTLSEMDKIQNETKAILNQSGIETRQQNAYIDGLVKSMDNKIKDIKIRITDLHEDQANKTLQQNNNLFIKKNYELLLDINKTLSEPR